MKNEQYERFRADQISVLEAQNVSVCINHADHKDDANGNRKCDFCIACEAAGNGNPCPCGCEGTWTPNGPSLLVAKHDP